MPTYTPNFLLPSQYNPAEETSFTIGICSKKLKLTEDVTNEPKPVLPEDPSEAEPGRRDQGDHVGFKWHKIQR